MLTGEEVWEICRIVLEQCVCVILSSQKCGFFCFGELLSPPGQVKGSALGELILVCEGKDMEPA